MGKIEATQEQIDAINYAGSMVVIAKPGSGKTYVVSEKVRAVLEESNPYQGVIAISYTNKASDELMKRCKIGGRDLHSSFLGTIDTFCTREIIRPFLPHLWSKPIIQPEVLSLVDISDRAFTEIKDIVGKKSISLPLLKENTGLVREYFLDGILILEALGALALYVLQNSSACKNYFSARYTHIFIDEYQDSGIDQHQLFLELVELGLTGVAVGDADQSIYGYSGRIPEYLLSLPKRKDFRKFNLTVNHRCDPSIRNYSMLLVDPDYICESCDSIHVYEKQTIGNIDSISRWIDENISNIIEYYGVGKLCDVAVLVKSNKNAHRIDMSLQTSHRCFYRSNLESSFSQWTQLLALLLRYKFEAKMNAEEVIDSVPVSFNSRDKRVLRSKLKLIRQTEEHHPDFINLCLEVCEKIHPNGKSDAAIESFTETLKDNKQMLLFHPANDDEVQIMTLHKAKGLEFDVVFHLDLYEWVIPFKSFRKLPNDKSVSDNSKRDLAQGTNLHYVGITRARKACFLCWSSLRYNSMGEVKQANQSEFLDIHRLCDKRIFLHGDFADR